MSAIDNEALRGSFATTPSKILMLVVDGLGGLPHPDTRLSELETASLPNLDALARESACGHTIPVQTGVAPGSGPGHLALFGYDPIKYLIGRGALEALGIDVELAEGDVAARGNFCTVDAQGNLTDRRAGRIPTAESAPLCSILQDITLDGVETTVYPVQDYRFVLHLRGRDLSDQVSETDPQQSGVRALEAQALSPAGLKTAAVVRQFVDSAARLLSERDRANMIMLRGFSQLPHLPSMGDAFQLNPGAIAAYPMYRGLASVAGMRVIPTGSTFTDEIYTLREHYHEHDFFFLHYKPADAAGEDGNFKGKVAALEALDRHIPDLLDLDPDVLLVAGDHSTPAIMASHSWHPVPFMIRSKWTRGEGVDAFSERDCVGGSLGTFPASDVMLLATAHAGKLLKFGP
jgi:2,3-bisphosphoglycerate-independent phosphoglycerate mutase